MYEKYELIIDNVTKILWLVLIIRWLWTAFEEHGQHVFILF